MSRYHIRAQKIHVVYMIKNVVNGKCYVGMSGQYKERIAQHFMALNNGNHINEEFQRDYEANNRVGFVFGIIEEKLDHSQAKIKERACIEDRIKSYNKLYNRNRTTEKNYFVFEA